MEKKNRNIEGLKEKGWISYLAVLMDVIVL
jgi:hypothetical protein